VSGVLLAVLAACVYGAGAMHTPRWPAARAAAFALGCATLGAALSPPVDAAADARPAAHMLQHLLLAVLAPALLAAGAPVRLALAALPDGGRRAVGRALRSGMVHALGRPTVAVPLAIAAFVAVHVPAMVDAALGSAAVHVAEHAALFYTGLLLWVVILAVDPVPAAPSPLGRLAWLTGVMIAMSVVGAVYSSAPHVLIDGYARLPDALGAQQDAGAVMWVGSGALMVPAMLVTVFAAMLREERLQQRREALRQ
jgi:putative membrane protein